MSFGELSGDVVDINARILNLSYSQCNMGPAGIFDYFTADVGSLFAYVNTTRKWRITAIRFGNIVQLSVINILGANNPFAITNTSNTIRLSGAASPTSNAPVLPIEFRPQTLCSGLCPVSYNNGTTYVTFNMFIIVEATGNVSFGMGTFNINNKLTNISISATPPDFSGGDQYIMNSASLTYSLTGTS